MTNWSQVSPVSSGWFQIHLTPIRHARVKTVWFYRDDELAAGVEAMLLLSV